MERNTWRGNGMSDLRDIATLCKEIDCLTAEVNTLRKERDEARRLSCISFEDIIALATTGIASAPRHKYYEHANGRGWDCFKENM
jgi:hypothetical protein